MKDDDMNKSIDEKRKLENPTVKDIIEYLSQFPPTLAFRIEDPDTGWTINIVHAECLDNTVWLTGYYHDMNTEPEGML